MGLVTEVDQKRLPKAVNNSGAVSPDTRATARITPVAIPDSAVRATTDNVVRQFGTPSANDASRSSGGTSSTISSVVRVTSGIIIAASATDPASVEKPPNGRTTTA